MSPRQLQPCGTPAAYQRHLNHGEKPCRPCAEVASEQQRIYARQRASRAIPRPRTPSPLDMTDALCVEVGGDLWFPGPGESARLGKKVCGLCPIEQTCLDYALQFDLDGTWGGKSHMERRKIQADRRMEPLAVTA